MTPITPITPMTFLFSQMDIAIEKATKNGHNLVGWQIVGYYSASTTCETCGAKIEVNIDEQDKVTIDVPKCKKEKKAA